MKVKPVYLVAPIVLIIVFIAAVTYVLQALNISGASLGYEYKEKLFQKDVLAEVNITVNENDWEQLLANPTAEEYIEASVVINDVTYNHVGVRAKGNSSLSSVASSDSDRYSLKLDFTQYDSTQTYYGLEKINLNNNFSDTTQMKEFVSYELMNQLSIPTPAYAYAKVMLNGEYYGLMLAVEEIGEAFVRTNYETSEGYIFKPEGNGSDLKYISDDTSDYDGIFNEVKYNEKTAEKNSNIISMLKEIGEGDTSSLNIDLIARYFALNTALVNMDSYQGSFKHNYYLYEDKYGKFSVLPWDYNMSFGGFTGMGGGGGFGNMGQPPGRNQNQNEVGKGTLDNQNAENLIGNNEIQRNEALQNNARFGGGGQGRNGLNISQSMMTDNNINFSITEPVSGTTIDERPLLKIILVNEEARELYEHYLEYIAKNLLTESNIGEITKPLKTLLVDAVNTDPTKFSTTEQFLAGIEGDESISAFAAARSESILKQLSGEAVNTQATSTSSGSEHLSDISTSPQQIQDNSNVLPPEGAMPQPPNFGENAQGTEGAMPQPPNFDEGQMPNFEGGGRPPQWNGDIPGRQAAESKAEPSIPPIIQYSIGFALLVLAIVFVSFMNSRKYKKGR